MLKPFHKVIDGVFLTENRVLLLIQISLAQYDDHATKASDLRTAYMGTKESILHQLLQEDFLSQPTR